MGRGLSPLATLQASLGSTLKRWLKLWVQDIDISGDMIHDGVTIDITNVLTTTNTKTATNKTLNDDTNDIRANKLYSAVATTPVAISGVPSAGQLLEATSATAAIWKTRPAADRQQYDYQTSLATTSTSLINMQDLSHTAAIGATRVYDISLSVEYSNSNADKMHTFAIALDGVAVTSRDSQTDKANLSNETSVHWQGSVAPGVVITAQYKTNGNTLTTTKRTLSVWGEI